jgi:GGDEF domain-containing protein
VFNAAIGALQQPPLVETLCARLYPNDGNTPDELLRNADKAMSMARHAGRSQPRPR